MWGNASFKQSEPVRLYPSTTMGLPLPLPQANKTSEAEAANKASEAEAAEGMAACVAAAAVSTGRLAVEVVVKPDITEAATAATVEVAVAGVGMFAAAAIVVVLDGKATFVFPAKSIQK
jgi:hypothetical protein